MKILITGANGQLGWEIARLSKCFEIETITMDHLQLDITNREQVRNALSTFQPDILVNSAAYTAVDKAESEPEIAFAINRDGPANLAESCAKQHIPLIHISTDFVFNGKKGSPYLETDAVSPISIYGKSKSEGEKEIVLCLKEYIIIRTSWLFGVHGHNFVKTMLKLGKERDVIRVVADQYGSPTSAEDLAESVLVIVKQLGQKSEIRNQKSEIRSLLPATSYQLPATSYQPTANSYQPTANSQQPTAYPWGIYHYCGKGFTTWHEFAKKIFEFAKEHGEIKIPCVEAIPTSEYPTPAKRPAFSVLDCSLIQKEFGIIPKSWKESLKTAIKQLYQ